MTNHSDLIARRAAQMQANGALDQKLDAWLKAQEMWATAFGNYKGNVTPQIVSGGTGAGAQNAATDFMSIIAMKSAKDLALDMSIEGKGTK